MTATWGEQVDRLFLVDPLVGEPVPEPVLDDGARDLEEGLDPVVVLHLRVRGAVPIQLARVPEDAGGSLEAVRPLLLHDVGEAALGTSELGSPARGHDLQGIHGLQVDVGEEAAGEGIGVGHAPHLGLEVRDAGPVHVGVPVLVRVEDAGRQGEERLVEPPAHGEVLDELAGERGLGRRLVQRHPLPLGADGHVLLHLGEEAHGEDARLPQRDLEVREAEGGVAREPDLHGVASPPAQHGEGSLPLGVGDQGRGRDLLGGAGEEHGGAGQGRLRGGVGDDDL
jgi:hypothetical protein